MGLSRGRGFGGGQAGPTSDQSGGMLGGGLAGGRGCRILASQPFPLLGYGGDWEQGWLGGRTAGGWPASLTPNWASWLAAMGSIVTGCSGRYSVPVACFLYM